MSELHTKFSVHIACGRGSVLFWRYCDILYIFGVVNDVTFAHNGQAKAQAMRIRAYAQGDSPWGSTDLIGCKFGI